MDRDKNLLFGILAAQLKRVTSSQLAEAAAAWVADPQKELAQHLVESGVLDDAGRKLVGDVLEVILKAHDGSSVAALVSMGGTEQVDQSFDGRVVLTSSGGVRLGSVTPDVRELSESVLDAGVRETPGRYTHPSLYASGGMGRVLLVHDEHLGRDIALKELMPSWSTESPTLQPGTPMRMAMPQIARFLQEARVTGQLEHPSIVPVYEVGYRTDGTLYYTMKLVRGKTLRKTLKEAGSLRERLRLLPHLQDLCHAIAYAHSRGVIHRDIKPANVMIGEFGETVVIDWGLAKVKNREDIHAGEMAETARLMRQGERPPAAQTVYGDVVGTPDYMPPEQARGDIAAIDQRSDVYSLGAVLYELLTGRPPYEAGEVDVIVQRVINEAPPSVLSCEPEAPRELAAICERAMRKPPEERYQSAKELADDMRRFLSGAIVQAYAYSFSEYLKRFVRKHKAILATAAAGLALLLVTGIVYNVQLIVARNNEHAQRVAAEAANQRLVWENYSVTLGAVQRHIDDRRTGRALALLDQSPPEHRNWEWGRLKRECQPEIWQLYDSDTGDNTYGMPVRILLSPDQRYVLCHRFHSGLKHVFDLQTGQNIYVEKAGAYTGWPDCTQFAPDSRRFATAVDAQHVGLWDFVERRQVTAYESAKGEIHSVAFSPDGRLLAGYIVDDTQTPEIVLWDTASAAVVKRFPLDRIDGALQDDPGPSGTSARYFAHVQGSVLGFFPDSVRLAFTDNRLGVLNTGTGERTYAGPSHRLARFAPASGAAATCALSGAVQIWDLNTNVKVSTLEKAPQLPRDMALSPDGKLLLTSSGRLQKWDTASGKLLYETPHGVFSINFSANGNVFACLEEHTFQIWDTKAALDTEYPRFHKDDGTPDSTELFFDFGKQPAYAYDPQCTELA
ncbi:MAG: protein kinase [Candidatus Hydrogenedentes bacterium]|nr:protein kinase [Candidatus Hydrogenedentota bacterium]